VYEVDFLPVGDGGRSGDAIALRYSAPNPANDDQVVVVIDGGFSDDGEALVEHITRYYGTSRVDLVVSTHPDGDHANGLCHLLEELTVGELLIHDPRTRLRDTDGLALDTVLDLIDLADKYSVPRTEPFTGLTRFDDSFLVAGPTQEYYAQMLDEQVRQHEQPPAEGIRKALTAAGTWLKHIAGRPVERLTDAGITSPRNNSSVICQVLADGNRLLFTADAGQPALTDAAEFLDRSGFSPSSWPLSLVQAPHHGSRRNVGPTVLNRLLGDHTMSDRGHCVASTAREAERHPNPSRRQRFRAPRLSGGTDRRPNYLLLLERADQAWLGFCGTPGVRRRQRRDR
jgi:hypothetical protein